MKKFVRLRNPGYSRRISVAGWKAPTHPSIVQNVFVDFTRCAEFLEKINRNSAVKVTATHIIAKAVALTLKKFPDLNAIIRWRHIYLRQSVDIFVNVVVPRSEDRERPDLSGIKIEDCDNKGLQQIALELQERTKIIRQGQDPEFNSMWKFFSRIPDWLLPVVLRLMGFLYYNLGIHSRRWGLPEDPFGSAVVTNVGSLGIPAAQVPLYPICRVSLAVCIGEVRERPWVEDGKVVARPLLDLGLTCDHRLIEGYIIAQMEKYFREIIENPEDFLLEPR